MLPDYGNGSSGPSQFCLSWSGSQFGECPQMHQVPDLLPGSDLINSPPTDRGERGGVGCAPLPDPAGPAAVHHCGRQVTPKSNLLLFAFDWPWSDKLMPPLSSVPGQRWRNGWRTSRWPLTWQRKAMDPPPSSLPAAPLTAVSDVGVSSV